MNTLSAHDYSPCINLSTSTYDSKIIRCDLSDDNEVKVVNKSLGEVVFPRRLNSEKYKKKLGRFAFPASMRKEKVSDVDPKNLEYFLNSYNPVYTKVFGLNSIGIQYKNLDLLNDVNHFQNIYDLKDALSDFICNQIDLKYAVILINLYEESGLEDCLAQCKTLPEKRVCADDGKEYYNIECLKCNSNLKEISCDQSVPLFRKEELTDKAFQIFYQFVEAQNLIANDKNTEIANDLIDNTIRLFDENKQVEILNLGTTRPIQLSTKQYLQRLLNRPFDEVAIEWNRDWTVIQDWTDAGTEIPESQMSAEGEQFFKGYRKNLVAYSDVIKKNVNFHAKLVESIDDDGNEVIEWKIFIGDITIASKPKEL
jgi:hypothetical protein